MGVDFCDFLDFLSERIGYTVLLMKRFWSFESTFLLLRIQSGQSMSQSHANNSKYLVYQKKIFSDQIRKSALFQVLQGILKAIGRC